MFCFISFAFCQDNKINDKILFSALVKHEIKHPHIVLAQAKLETGNYKYLNNNNLFGLRHNKGYYKYEHWEHSIIAYKEKIQKRYRMGEDYYNFLKRIKYAENPNYIKHLKQIKTSVDTNL